MNKMRLLKLADLLEADAKNKKGVKFDLGSWGEPAGRRRDFKNQEPSLDCSTAACAFGLACLSGAFKRSGLTYSVVPSGEDESDEPKAYIVPRFNDVMGFDAAEYFFEITYSQAKFLFEETKYPRGSRKGAIAERAVAKRIRDFVAGELAA